MMSDPVIKHFDDIGYVVWARIGEANDCYVDVKAYAINARDTDGIYLYQRAGATNSMDLVESINEAELFLSGSVKWDGCSNLRFDEQDHVMLHFCSKKDAVAIGTLLGRVYDIAHDILPRAAS